ncbi:Capsule biosynthesis protein CapA [compost metagenome]
MDAVNLANNHTLDQGVEGLLDTMRHLKDNSIQYFGAGKNKSEAYAPIYFERKGIRIALCGFSRVIPKADWAAGKNKPGVAAVYDPAEALKTVKTAREAADLVIVVTHWGKERTTELEKHQTSLARSFIDAGADLIIGGHPHVLQGIEQYKGKWIAYSTGNFIFTKKSSAPDTWDTAVFEAKCTKKGDCQMKLLPFRTEIGQPVPLKGEEAAQVLKRVESLSQDVKINSNGEVHYLK